MSILPHMPDTGTAQRHYDAGLALLQEKRYAAALIELQTAEEAFRRIDARGHPFNRPLANGVSGLANTLSLIGHCHRQLGDHRRAAMSYETSLINGKFERRRPFRAFLRSVNADLLACYEHLAAQNPPGRTEQVLRGVSALDTASRFPFSLGGDALPLARMYELAPERHGHLGEFYARARDVDAQARRNDARLAGSASSRMGLYVWGVLLAIWAVYGAVVVKALLRHQE